MKTLEACKRDVVIAYRDTPLAEAAKRMRARHVGCIVVVEKDDAARPVGILTDRDIVVEVVAAELDPRSITVGEVMTAPIVTVNADDDALDTLKVMRIRGVRRVPVVDGTGALAGLASLDDLLEIAGDTLNDVVGAIVSERSIESWVRR